MNLLATTRGKKILFCALYFSEGAPIGFIWFYLPTQLSAGGVAEERITGLIALLVLPWAFKVLTAPLVDLVRGPRWTFKHWIIVCQVAMGAALAPLTFVGVVDVSPFIVCLLFAHVLAAVVQDAAIDALCIAETDHDERGGINGWMQVGMQVGRTALGGVALVLADYISESQAVGLLIACIWGPMLLLALAAQPTRSSSANAGRRIDASAIGKFARQLLTQKIVWWGLLFALVGGAAFEAVGAISGPYFVERGFEKDEIGWFRLVPVLACTLGGSLVGGWLADRLGHRWTVVIGQMSIVGCILALAATDWITDERPGLAAMFLIAALYVGIGVFTVASYALLMDITTPPAIATQFSAFMGATNGCEAWATFAIGRLVSATGYAAAFALVCVPSVLALGVLPKLRRDDQED
jgi:MFS family permease